MPDENTLPLPLIDAMERPAWWSAHLFLDDAALDGAVDELSPTVAFALPGGGRLLLTVTSFSSELAFALAGEDPVSVAWDDEAHWHPALLRWVEFEAVIAHAIGEEPWSARPEFAIALLHRFAAVVTDDELRRASELITPAMAALGLTGEQTGSLLERIDWRPGRDDALVGPGWVRDPAVGWRLEVFWRDEARADGLDELPAPYSLRRPENESFPPALVHLLDRLAGDSTG